MRKSTNPCMAEQDKYATIRIDKEVRDEARVTKAKLGVTWSEFITRAAQTLEEQASY